jgi:transcriptional regulator with XRE-family HTH domain
VAASINPTVRRRRLGAELGRLRKASGLTSAEAAERLMVSQSKISRMENGRRAISLRDVRDLCALYGVTDQQVIDLLMELARDSGQQGWWHAYGDIPDSVYVGLETEAASIHAYEPLVIPGLLQTPAYAHAVIGEAVPPLTAEQAAARLKVRLRRQHRIYDPARPLRLWLVLDEAVLRRVVGSHDVMREQLEYLNAFGAEPHITVQVLPYAVGAHPGLSGQFSILQSTDGPEAGVVYLERFTSGIYLEKPSDVQHYSVLYDHLQAQALDPDSTRRFITNAIKSHIGAASRP